MPPVASPWESAPGAYSAQCSSVGGANVLAVTPRRGAPVIHPSPVASWGLHLVDVNLALGNLISVVRSESVAYRSSH
jgi:hypothetical protein